MQSARWSLKLVPDDAKPYNALTMKLSCPCSPQTQSLALYVPSLNMELSGMYFVHLLSSPPGHLVQPKSGQF